MPVFIGISEFALSSLPYLARHLMYHCACSFLMSPISSGSLGADILFLVRILSAFWGSKSRSKAYSHRRIYVLMGKTLWACVVTSVIVLVRLFVSHTPSILFVYADLPEL
jgi:hypothetical protein